MTTKARRVAGPCVVLWIALVLSVIGGASVVAAQTPSGVIQGNIRDVSAGVLPGVVVTATHAETGRSLVALSNGRGDYEVSGLEVGEYDVSALLPGFRSQPFTVTVTAGETETLDLVLTIAPLAETVIVTRTDQQLSAVPQSVAVVERDQIEFAQRRASLDEALPWHSRALRSEPTQLRSLWWHRAEYPRAAAPVWSARGLHYPGRYPDHHGRRHDRTRQPSISGQ